MDKYSKIYVAGHNGLVGSAIVKKLKKEGYTNLVLRSKSELDLRHQGAVKNFFLHEKPDYVFLAAAKVGGINWNWTNPGEFIYDNLQIQTNVIDSAYQNGVKKLMFLGSACIYPKVTPQPIKEEYLLTAPLEPTNEGYALAKITGLRMCEYYRRQYGFNAISVMPANLYGPNDNFIPEHGHVIPGIITKLNNAMKNGDASIDCWGDGTPTREFLYVDDLADACFFLMQTYNEAQFINIGSDEELTIKELAEKLKDGMGFTGSINWDTSKPNGTPRRKMDNSKLFALGWRPKVSFDEGLKTTIEWYKTNKVNV
jgi:GDP-L-fucose synthase